MKKKTRAVVFGGTFDPIQEGHAAAIRHLLERFELVIVAPTSQNPFKERIPTSLELRIQMIHLVLAAENIPLTKVPLGRGVFVSDFIYQRSRQFVEHWRELAGEDVSWAIGEDLVHEVPNWSDGWIAENVTIVGVPETIAVHATDVRQGRIPPHPAIRPLIEEHELYVRVS